MFWLGNLCHVGREGNFSVGMGENHGKPPRNVPAWLLLLPQNVTPQGEKRCVTGQVIPPRNYLCLSRKRESPISYKFSMSVPSYRSISIQILKDWLFCFISSFRKKNSRVSQDSPQVKKKIRKTEAERQIDRGLKLSVRFLVISQKAYLKNVQITNSRPRNRKSYNYAN